MRTTLVVTTYERPDALAAVLATARAQRQPPDELIVADDGSGKATRTIVDESARQASFPIRHICQEHDGFRAGRVRNLAIAAARGEYIVCVDGDMLLHPLFIADHRRAARRGTFVQGIRIPLDSVASNRAIANPLAAIGPFSRGNIGLRRIYTKHSATASRFLRILANRFVALKACNQAYWRDDLVAVNGYNEDMTGWGSEDKELCARLVHAGRSRRTLVFAGIAFHLDHAPASRDRRSTNEAILAATLATRSVRCLNGLSSHML